MEFSDTQKAVTKCLLARSKTLEEIRDETKLSAIEVNEAIKTLTKLKLIEKTDNNKYKLIDYITEKIKEGKTKMAKSDEIVFKANLIIEGAGEIKEQVEKQISILEEKLRKEPYKFLKIEKSTVELVENTYCMFIDVDVEVPRFKDLIYLIITYGPSSVELLEPARVELSLGEAQDLLNSIVSTVHYYVTYILQLHLRNKKKLQISEQVPKEPPEPKSQLDDSQNNI